MAKSAPQKAAPAPSAPVAADLPPGDTITAARAALLLQAIGMMDAREVPVPQPDKSVRVVAQLYQLGGLRFDLTLLKRPLVAIVEEFEAGKRALAAELFGADKQSVARDDDPAAFDRFVALCTARAGEPRPFARPAPFTREQLNLAVNDFPQFVIDTLCAERLLALG